jgi:hypothetical protein
MTQSLLSSWQYQFRDFSKYEDTEKGSEFYEEKAHQEFLQTLRREKTPPNEYMQRGIDFENAVVSICNGTTDPLHEWHKAASEIADIVRGSQFQHVVKKNVTIAGIDFLLYGKVDALKAGEVNDIKFTQKYEVGKFFNSPQHPLYMECVPEAVRFNYLVSNGKRVWTETYRRDECKPISEVIEEFIGYLRTTGLWEVYTEHWKARGD